MDGQTSSTPIQTSKESLTLLDLPNDILDLIISNLDLVDRFHLRLVCKSFSTLVRSATRIGANTKFGVPCLLVLARDLKTCNLINPQHREKYNINTPSLPANAKIVYVKDGWLLMVFGDRPRWHQRSLFFFNPLTKATIRLPDLISHHWEQISFSCAPTSPDCIVIAMCSDEAWAEFKICRRGDEQWSGEIRLMGGFSFNLYDTNAVFYRGSFYYLGDKGSLGMFDPVKLTWTVTKKSKSTGTTNSCDAHDQHLIESEGQLLRVIWDDSSEKTMVDIQMLDNRKKRWKKVDGFGDTTLYVSFIASLSSKALPASSKRNVYFPIIRGEEVASLSFKTCEVQNFYSTRSSYCPDGCWIEPDCTQSSPEELQWSKT